jgi:hypothetical protein
MSSQKWTISIVKQGKFKVSVVPPDHILQKNYFLYLLNGVVYVAMSAGANRMIFLSI